MRGGQDPQRGPGSPEAEGRDHQAGLQVISILLLVCVAGAESMAAAYPAAHNLCAAVVSTRAREARPEHTNEGQRLDVWTPDGGPATGGPACMAAPFWRWPLMAAFACVWAVCHCLSLCTAHTTECMNIKTPECAAG